MDLFGNKLLFIVENKNRTIFDNQFFLIKNYKLGTQTLLVIVR